MADKPDFMAEFAAFMEQRQKAAADGEDFAVDLEVTRDGATHKVAGVPWSKIPAATREALGLGDPPEGDQGDQEGSGDGKPAGKTGGKVLDYFGKGAAAGRKASGTG